MLSMLLVEFRMGLAWIIYEEGMARSSDDLQQKSRKSRTDLDRGNSLIFIIITSNLFVQNSRSATFNYVMNIIRTTLAPSSLKSLPSHSCTTHHTPSHNQHY